MNVTCERCNTEYDFDDTLVSGRGTTVKCTNCGHLFKVRKAGGDPAVATEKWVVRTVDGRELQFNALRELQAAITQRTIGREDVLSRGSSRPRRLGAISELEPFFTATAGGHAPAPGLGATAPLVPSPRGHGASPLGLPSAHVPDPEGAMDSSDMQEDATVVRPPPVDPDTIPKPMFPPPARAADKPATKPATKELSPPPGKVPGAAKDGSPPPGKVPGAAKDGSPLPGKVPGAAKDGSPPPGKIPGAAKDGSPPPGKVPKEAPPLPGRSTTDKGALKTSSAGKEASGQSADASAEKAPEKPAARPPEKPPARPPTKDASPPPRGGAGAAEKETKDAPAEAADVKAPPRKLPVTAPASDVKISHIGEEEPRFSTPRPQPKRPGGGAQRLVAIVAVGVLIFVGVTAARRFMSKPTPPPVSSAPDQRVSSLLSEAEKSLSEGDLQGAQSQLDKASALAEKDPKIATALALVATIQADFKWLKLRLLPVGDATQAASKLELDAALERARKAVEGAQALAPNEPAVARRRIDVLRIAGSLVEARKIVPSISSTGGQTDSALVLATLDLAEEKPSWPSVIERLRTAASGEHGLGRARSMLIYALVRSGDVPGAKSEVEQLAAMPRQHTLLPLLREFVARSEAPIADAGADAADLSPDEALRLANDLRARGESKRAEELLLDVLKKAPTNADAAAALGDIARSRSDTAAAQRYYDQALKLNPTNVMALSGLGDMKWDQNDRQGALPFYRKVTEVGGSSPYVARARERLGGKMPEEAPGPANVLPTSPTTPPSVPTTEPPTPPTPTATTEPTTPPAPTPTPTPTPTPPPTPTKTAPIFEMEP